MSGLRFKYYNPSTNTKSQSDYPITSDQASASAREARAKWAKEWANGHPERPAYENPHLER